MFLHLCMTMLEFFILRYTTTKINLLCFKSYLADGENGDDDELLKDATDPHK